MQLPEWRDLENEKLNRMTRQELELKAKEFDSKLKRHPMSSEELQNVLCDFAEALRIHDVVGRSEQLKALLEKLLENNMCSHTGDELIEEALKGF